MNDDSLNAGRKLTIGAILIFAAEGLILPTGFITAVFLARRLGPLEYGLFALVSRFIYWLEWTGTSAFTGTTIKFISQEREWRPVGATAVRLYLLIGGGLALIILILSKPLALFFHEPALAGHLRLFAIDVPIFSLACANTNILMGLGRFKTRALISSGRWISRLILIILFVEMGLSIRGAIMGSIGASLVELILSILFTRPPLLARFKYPLRPFLGFAAPLFLSGLSQRILRLDLFALKALGGTAVQAGYYGAAQNLSITPAIFSGSLAGPLLSTLNRLQSRGEEDRAREIGITAMRISIWLVPFAAMTAGAAPEIIDLIFGRTFLAAGPLLAVLIFAALGMVFLNITRVILITLDKPGWTFTLSGPLVPLALIGHLIFIPRYGGLGAAIVTTAVIFIGALASALAVHYIWQALPPMKTVFRSAFCSGLAFALAALWPASGLVLIVKLVVISLIILLTLFISGEFTVKELDFARSVIRWRVDEK